jgi:hypothetical protein
LSTEVIMGVASGSSKDLVFTTSGRGASISTGMRMRMNNNSTSIGDLVFMGSGSNIAIASSNVGNLILVANNGAVATGTIPAAGGASVQFNSDILLSAKSIKAVNNNITVDTVTNDFTGALVVKATNKSGFHRVKSGTKTNNVVTEIDRLPTTNATEKANKYMLYMQDTTTSSTCAIVEFTVLANNATYALKINSVIQNGISTSPTPTFVELRTPTTRVGAPVDENGTTIPQLESFCGTFTTTTDFLSIIIDPCISGTFNYTLYKMSIQA